MKKFFLIPLLTLFCSVMAWAEMPEPQPFAFNEGIAPAAQKAPVHRVKAEAAEQDVLLEYEGFSQHFTSLQAAFNALPENSTPATVTLLSNIHVDYEGTLMSVAKFQRVTLDLNGDSIFGSTTAPANSAVITNYGTLTIIDSQGTGFMSNRSDNPDVSECPTYGNYILNNFGTLTINGGTFYSYTPGAAAYPLNNTQGATAIINGGHLYNPAACAIRLYCGTGSKEDNNHLVISGGLIEGYCAIWIQTLDNGEAPKVTLDMTGGEIRSRTNCYYYANNPNPDNKATCTLQNAGGYMHVSSYAGSAKTNASNVTMNITGGVINENFYVVGGGNINISGGRFNGWACIANQNHLVIKGGIFDCTKYYGLNLAPGYVWKYIGSTPENKNEDPIYEVVPAHSEEVTESKTMAEIAQEIEDSDEVVEASIIVIDATSEDDHAVVTVTEDIAVEGIVINTEDGKKEGQIVVESGVTLTVGNSGIVSENNDLTTVVVKPGGTIMIGNGGVDQQGTAIPVEIQSTGTESGVFMVDPNAPATVAEAPAKVKVYTRAHKDNGIEYWQQMASPVKGDHNNGNQITVTPLGELQGNHNFLTSLYSWDYATDSWARITDGMEQISEGVYAFRGDAVWTTSDAVLKPFAAYDLINNSHAYHGGVTYEFAGELVGNGDMVLNFPEKGFCTFGNSYTAPIDLVTLFAKIENDMQASTNLDNTNIDPCVYMYNSSADRFESVNSLGLWLKELGIIDVAFTQIPPQQAFVMNLLSGNSAQSAVDYATCVWGNPNTNKNTPIMAPSRQQAASFSALLNIEVTDGEATDRVVLIEDEKYSEAYDNGADAEKYMNNTFNIYANAERNLAMVATDNIENTELSFKAGKAVNYTMTFGKTMGDFVLVDRANNNQIAIVEGGIYTFAAQPNATAESRFAIVPAAKLPTAIENTGVKTNAKGIYTIMGQYLGENFDILPAGVYVIDGVKIVK